MSTTDTEYLTYNALATGYQVSSLLAPPVYAATVLARRGRRSFSVNHLLRTTWLAGLGGGAVYGGLAYAWYKTCNEAQLRAKRLETSLDNKRVGRNDYAAIGLVLMAVLTPALLWRRARTVDLVLGGAGLGSGIGLLTYDSLPSKSEGSHIANPK